jgi:glycosyltransferase involved in cell wall biosynthesis
MFNPSINILLATYNGQNYLTAQIDSILAQSYHDWQLLIRDDGSSDDTVSIIKDYIAEFPDKIRLITDEDCHLGASLNFGRLLEYADTEYIMFSDQDDVWLPDKIKITLKVMKATERRWPDKPVLVHTDLKIIDADSNIIADSMWSYQKLFPEIGDKLNKIMAHNVVTGCAMMINRKARMVSLPVPKEAVMHDWWIAIKVAKHGKIAYVPITSVLYRQHLENKIGAKRAQKIYSLLFWKKLRHSRELLSAQYEMVKKVDPGVNFWSLILNKVLIKIAQQYR